ncbi:MAG TPA: hypothetical protein VE869_01665 [Gemmatimonas sp.]|nr:hypothetical protein [Gemmatimonas sp.]
MRRWLQLWFTFDHAVDRRAYILSGASLAAVKYAGDVLIVWLVTGRTWHVAEYFGSVASIASLGSERLTGGSTLLLPALSLWALPFLWIGVSMSMRRALDAGLSAWLSLLFFVPGVNYLLFAALSAWPTDPQPQAGEEIPRSYEARLPKALLAMATGATLGLGMLALSVFGLESYGIPLFLGTPFVMGALTAFLFNRRYPATATESRQVVLMTLALVAGTTLLAAAEGALCLIMAAPLGIGISLMGGTLGRRIALRDSGGVSNALLAVMLLPATAAMEADRAPSALREVRSSVIIDASAADVWRNVIQFPPLPEPTDLVFRAGIAYPQRATIQGEGVGAVRYCVFSTGAFVEPITVWEPGRRLSFDVTEQPKPMQEWSPYADISPPHLDGYFRSKRGKFRLVALPDGRTRLEGSTWYEMRLEPAAYWVLFGDALIARIHHRVLDHIRTVTEQ